MRQSSGLPALQVVEYMVAGGGCGFNGNPLLVLRLAGVSNHNDGNPCAGVGCGYTQQQSLQRCGMQVFGLAGCTATPYICWPVGAGGILALGVRQPLMVAGSQGNYWQRNVGAGWRYSPSFMRSSGP